MPRNQLYQVRNGKTYRECDGVLYILDGIATNVQKAQLSGWLRSHTTSGDDMPDPWYIEDDTQEDVELDDNIRIELEKVGGDYPGILNRLEEQVENIVFREYPNVAPEEVASITKRVCVKPIIYNIKQVPDDRRRTGYTEYRRL